MRLLIDATAIPADRGGVGRYVDELVPALARAGVSIVVACQPRDAERFATAAPGVDVAVGPRALERRPARLAWEQLALPRLARSVSADVLHSPHYTMPRFAGLPVTVTLHDATFFTSPELHLAAKARFFRAATRAAVRRAASIVVPSAATRDEVLRVAGGRSDQFFVAHHGVDRAVFHPVDDDERRRVARSLGLDERRYVAFLGTLEPRKNVPALIRGWVRAVGELADPPALVLAGARGWDDAVDGAIAEVPEHLTVLRPGYLPLDDLAGLLAGAQVVAYPSLGEGFGLPVLEAMACGAAVLTTRLLSLPEVGGDAVSYCEPTAEGVSAGLGALLADESARDALSGAAVARAALFTWDAAAAVHLEAYAAAISARGAR